MRARRDTDVCTNPVEGGMDIRELNHCRGKVAQLLEPPERSATNEVVMLTRLARRSQRKIRLACPEVAYVHAYAELSPDFHIKPESGLDDRTGRGLTRIGATVDQLIVLA